MQTKKEVFQPKINFLEMAHTNFVSSIRKHYINPYFELQVTKHIFLQISIFEISKFSSHFKNSYFNNSNTSKFLYILEPFACFLRERVSWVTFRASLKCCGWCCLGCGLENKRELAMFLERCVTFLWMFVVSPAADVPAMLRRESIQAQDIWV